MGLKTANVHALLTCYSQLGVTALRFAKKVNVVERCSGGVNKTFAMVIDRRVLIR